MLFNKICLSKKDIFGSLSNATIGILRCLWTFQVNKLKFLLSGAKLGVYHSPDGASQNRLSKLLIYIYILKKDIAIQLKETSIYFPCTYKKKLHLFSLFISARANFPCNSFMIHAFYTLTKEMWLKAFFESKMVLGWIWDCIDFNCLVFYSLLRSYM